MLRWGADGHASRTLGGAGIPPPLFIKFTVWMDPSFTHRQVDRPDGGVLLDGERDVWAWFPVSWDAVIRVSCSSGAGGRVQPSGMLWTTAMPTWMISVGVSGVPAPPCAWTFAPFFLRVSCLLALRSLAVMAAP